jgi:chromosome partitioning protein
MTQVLAFTMQKGGVGKTTSALNIASNLVKKGQRILLVDLDPQANATQGLGIDLDEKEPEYSVYEVLLNPEKGVSFATIQTNAGVDLVPSTLNLAGAESELSGIVGRELLLREALNEVQGKYDYVFIDSPPNLGLFTLNAMAAATSLLVPVQAHVYAYKALPKLEKTIGLVRKLNPTLAIGGMFVTQFDSRTNLSTTITIRLRNEYKDLVFETVIPLNTKLAESPAAGQPIAIYNPTGAGAKAYLKLTDEIEMRYAKK